MKVFISVDMEGISGLVRWMDVSPNGIDFAANRIAMTHDANAAIRGAFDAGATAVVVEENHGVEDLCVLDMNHIDDRCSVIRGAGRPGASTMVGLTENVGVALLIGHHARAGSFPGIMAHTISYEAFKRVLLAGNPIGEVDFFTIRAGELGVPVGMVSGDQVIAEQLREICPQAETVITKQALSTQAAECLSPNRCRELITAGAQAAVARAIQGELVPCATRGPYEFEVELRAPAPQPMRENLSGFDYFELLDEQRVRVTAPNMEQGFRRVAYLGYAHRPGVVRH